MYNTKDIYEQYKEIFDRYDYNFKRYGIKFTIAIVKLNKKLENIKMGFRELVRKTDDKIYIDNEYRLIIFMNTDLKRGYDALLTLEKEIIIKYNLINFDENIFKAAVVEKKRNRDIAVMIDRLFMLVNSAGNDCLIVTEDDLC